MSRPQSMAAEHNFNIARDPDTLLQTIVAGTASETGEEFFAALVRQLCLALGTHGAWVTEYLPAQRRLRALAFRLGEDWVDEYEYDVVGTPCEPVIDNGKLLHIPDNVVQLYPDDPDLEALGAMSYLGIPLTDANGFVLGHLAVLDNKPMPEDPSLLAVFRIFAVRAAAELRWLRAEAAIRERERQLDGLVTSAMDGVLQMDAEMRILRMNPSAARALRTEQTGNHGNPLEDHIVPDQRERLAKFLARIETRRDEPASLWIPNGITLCCSDGHTFPAEATLSRFELNGEPYYTLIFRNIDDRLEAERRIEALSEETRLLREELGQLQHFHELIGESTQLASVLRDLRQVAATDSTVLVLGETGTGKELIARALHAESARRDHRLVRINCAAIPANLMESEFFGHEKGAFTGATQRREGRFALADGGILFLDEVAELPLDLQVKLLRVLREGEYEAVGSNHTRKVDVRIVAATNRDLEAMVRDGGFREDLFYRLNVFPIRVPPLRARGEDIIRLAEHFLAEFARDSGKRLRPLDDDDRRRLRAYAWPGNVRELQNVMERAVITAENGRVNLRRALPYRALGAETTDMGRPLTPERVLTADELRALERDNISHALESCHWRVSGPRGAADKLGLPASTLASRMKALGIRRSR